MKREPDPERGTPVEPWYDEPTVVEGLPWLYRAYALYSRRMANRSTGRVLGGSLMHRVLARVTRALALADSAMVQTSAGKVFVDLLDSRMLIVLHEIRAQQDEFRIMRHVLHAGDTFIDVGANHGSFSMVAARLVGPTGIVLAVEPQPRLATLLRKSFAANNYSHCHCVELACSDRTGQAELFIPDTGSGSAGLVECFSGRTKHRTVSVRMTPLDDEADWKSFSGQVLIKLDVEGSELAFLRGAERLIRHHRPLVILEINPTTASAAGYTISDLLDRLDGLGYRRFAEIDQYPKTISRSAVRLEPQRNLVALPSPFGRV